MRKLLLMLMVVAAAAQATPQGKDQEKDGVIQGKVTHPGTADGIAEVQVTLQGPARTLESAGLNGLYTPKADLTTEMREQISRLIDSAPPGTPPQAVATAAARMEAQLLGLPVPTPILNLANSAGQPAQSAPPQVTAITDADGTFSFKKLAPGRYTIRAQRDGYFGLPPAGTAAAGAAPTSVTANATVVAGQATADLALALVAGGVVSGTLRDPNGKTLPNLNITAYQITYRSDGRGQLQSAKSTTTDDRGYYRLFYMLPGDYLIAVTPRRPGAAPSSQDVFVRTFYPGLVDPRVAPPLTVAEGGDVSAIDILIRAEATAKISGRMVSPFVSPTGQPTPPGSNLYLLPRDPNALAEAAPTFTNTASNRSNGQFEIRNVPPGSYDLVGLASDTSGRANFGRARIEVGNRDMEDVSIAIHPGVELKVRMTVDGGPPKSTPAPQRDPVNLQSQLRLLDAAVSAGLPAAEAVRQADAFASLALNGTSSTVMRSSIQLQLRSKDMYSALESTANANTSFDPSGLFVFPNVPEGRYDFQVSTLPANAYVEDIREGSISIYDEGLSIAGGVAGAVDVIINTKGATVKGTVVDAKQQSFASARIVLVPKQTRRQNAALYKTTTSDTTGNFTINGIAPGEYKVFAWDSVPANAWLNADFLAEYESRGTSVTVTAGAPASAEVTLISKQSSRR